MRRNDEAALVLTTIACSRRLIALAGRRSNSTTNQAKIQQEHAVAQSKYSNHVCYMGCSTMRYDSSGSFLKSALKKRLLIAAVNKASDSNR